MTEFSFLGELILYVSFPNICMIVYKQIRNALPDVYQREQQVSGLCFICVKHACSWAHLHINLLKKESKLARHVQILKRRNWVMAMMKLSWWDRREKTLAFGFTMMHVYVLFCSRDPGCTSSIPMCMQIKKSCPRVNLQKGVCYRHRVPTSIPVTQNQKSHDTSLLLKCHLHCGWSNTRR